MSDPAIDAAKRAIGDVQRSEPYRWAEKGAREALAPLRELHQKTENWAECGDDECPCAKPEYVCSCQLGHSDFLLAWGRCPTARAIYSSDELGDTP